MLITIYFILIVSAISIFVFAWKNKSAISISWVGIIVILFVVVFLTTHQVQNKIETPWLSIQSQLSQIQNQQKELQKITTLLIKISYISQDMGMRVGPLPLHKKRIDKYIVELDEYLPPNFREDIETEIQDLVKAAGRKQ